MVAQGWYRDPFGAHDDRWFSEGYPTRLVRDGYAESYDEPPPGGPSVPFAAAGTGSPGAAGEFRVLDDDWHSWTIVPPCLMAVLVTAVAFVAGWLGLLLGNSHAGGETNPAWVGAGMAGALIAMPASLLVAVRPGRPGRLLPPSQPFRGRALAAWGIVFLQTGWIFLAFRLAS